jgi:hypothetical protein
MAVHLRSVLLPDDVERDVPRRDDAPMDAPIPIILDGTVIRAGLPA